LEPYRESELLSVRVVGPGWSQPVAYEYHFVSEERAAELLSMVPRDRLPIFLLSLGQYTTIVVRALLYQESPATEGVTLLRRRVEASRYANEIMHGLMQQVRLAHTGGRGEYSPESFCRSLYRKARHGDFEWEFATNAMARALLDALSHEDSQASEQSRGPERGDGSPAT
jgi:hypothetical protein